MPRVRLHGQPVLLREMMRNLVDNALQYTPAGGTVTARVVADPFGQVVVLQVEDTGPGIAEAERELVFQPFYRPLDTDDRRQRPGPGHRARGGRPAWRRDLGGRRAGARGRRGQRHRAGHADHGALSGAAQRRRVRPG